MKIPNVLILFFVFQISLILKVNGQSYFESQSLAWLQQAESLKPELVERIKAPVGLVQIVDDSKAFQGVKAIPKSNMDDIYNLSFKDQKVAVIDFGEHLTGLFSFHLKVISRTADGPVRLKFTFGEVPSELAVPFDPYPGALSRAWLQDEIVTVTTIPAEITIPRRLAFRYVKIELLGSSPYFDFAIDNMKCVATTSATKIVEPLAPDVDPEIASIDRVGLNTLRECMQTVYEDGPKRDQRLWIGDLYLESLANRYSFKNYQLTKRCLYLLAAFCDDEGFIHANVFERPEPHPQQGSHIVDYALLFNAALLEYVKATGDLQTASDLWPVAKRQVEYLEKLWGQNALFNPVAAKDLWVFVDWKDGLDKQASIQGLMVFAINKTIELAKLIEKDTEVKELPALAGKMRKAARKQLWDEQSGIAYSGPKRQISLASQTWMVLGGILSKEEGKTALNKAVAMEDCVMPGAPYLYHYYIEALIQCGMNEKARSSLIDYWGGMVKKGADTFWEVYNPHDESLSPYHFYPVNSYCHAWSCTPVYFIRKYPGIFQ